MEALKKHQLEKADWISWSAYHASIQEAVIPPAAINAVAIVSGEKLLNIFVIDAGKLVGRKWVDNISTRYSLHITTKLQTAQRVDVVFDTYIQKCTTRQKRVNGVQRQVASTTVVPKIIGKTSYRLMRTVQIFVPGGCSSPN